MGAAYILVNNTKREKISFTHLEGSKPRELAGNPCQAAVTTWYLLKNQEDEIQFVSDTYDDWPFKTSNRDDTLAYVDKTFDVVEALIEQDILKDLGFEYIDKDEPETVFVRKIVNVWID